MGRVLFIFLALSIPVYADTALDELISRLQMKYENLQSLRAGFTQSYVSKRFSDRITEKGIVTFRKGGFMKWEYQQPESKIFVSDGTYFYYYVVRDKQVVKALMDENVNQRSPALFLAGRGNFVKDFHADWADPRPGSHLIKLTPIHPQADLKYMIVDVDPVIGLILTLDVVDPYDNRTEFAFQQIQENPSLPANFFAFQPPPGTDIVFQRGDTE